MRCPLVALPVAASVASAEDIAVLWLIRGFIASLIALVLLGCASMSSKVRSMSTAELELRRQQIVYRLQATAGEWSYGWGPGSHDVISQRNDLLKEKEAIENELLRRRHTQQ